ncbi:hypothetical protein MNBD_ALPHA06-901 [hydrothermal vent metagenome]|uniref:ABC-2 type transporter transmembrane domain-containing protein n=1 Tax=hydrothermal vent metagenome TaxID=652676 RepID=A0A3B0R3I0_9ZZZZ
MRHIYLIARREYLSYVATVGFWVSLGMIPVFLLLGMALPGFLDRASPVRNFVVIDQSTQYSAAIERSFASDKMEMVAEVIDALISVEGETSELLTAKQAILDGRSESEVAALLGPQRQIALSAVRANFRMVDAPAQTIEQLRPFLLEEQALDFEIDGKAQYLHAAIFVEPSQDGAVTLKYWSTNVNENRLRRQVRNAVRDQMRINGFAKAGVDLKLVSQIAELAPVVTSLSPEKAADNAEITSEDRLPFFMAVMFAFVLWSVVFSVANMLLTSVIEEKSNKILDSLLCAAPLRSVLMGKLFGVAAVSFTLLAGWAFAALISAALAGSVIGDVGGKMGGVLSAATDPGLLIPFFGYFVFGYLMFGSVFLALGSLCESLQEAQTLMTPMIFLMMVPMMALMFAMQDPESPILAILSWIPLFTPYIMMARLPTDPPLIEIIGTTLLMVASTALVLLAASKVFRAGAMQQAGADYFKKMLSKWLPSKNKAA